MEADKRLRTSNRTNSYVNEELTVGPGTNHSAAAGHVTACSPLIGAGADQQPAARAAAGRRGGERAADQRARRAPQLEDRALQGRGDIPSTPGG